MLFRSASVPRSLSEEAHFPADLQASARQRSIRVGLTPLFARNDDHGRPQFVGGQTTSGRVQLPELLHTCHSSEKPDYGSRQVNARAKAAMMIAAAKNAATVPDSRAFYDKKRAQEKSIIRPCLPWRAFSFGKFCPCSRMVVITKPFHPQKTVETSGGMFGLNRLFVESDLVFRFSFLRVT